MEHTENSVYLTWLRIIMIATLVGYCCRYFSVIAQASDDAKAMQLKNNVVSVSTDFIFDNESNKRQGFGFIVGNSNGKLIIVTADHVIHGKDRRFDETIEAIKVKYHSDQGHDYPATVLYREPRADVTVIEAKRPTQFNWDTDVLDRSENIQRGTEVWYVGRTGGWHVPPIPGMINSEPFLGKFTIDGLRVLPGTSGAPVVSSTGIIGMVITDAPASDTEAVSIGIIQQLLKRWNTTFLLTEASLTGRLHVVTNPTDALIELLNSDLRFHQGIELDSGDYRVSVSSEGYDKKILDVSVRPHEDTRIEVHLPSSLPQYGGRHIIGGGPAGGTFHSFADSIEEYTPVRNLQKFTIVAQSSGGATENLRKTHAGRQSMSLVYQSVVWLGRNGQMKNDTKKYDNVVAVAWLYGAPAQLVVRKFAGIRSVRDLVDKKVGVGNAGSSAFAQCELFFSHMGVWDRIERNAMGYNSAAAAFGNRQLDAFWLFTAFPSGSVIMAAQANDIDLIDLGVDADSSGFFKKYPCFTRTSIPAGTYRGVNHNTRTFQDSTLWVANAQVPESVVYDLLSIIYSDSGLRYMRSKKKTFSHMSIATGAKNIVIPFHPGAEKFWKDKRGF